MPPKSTAGSRKRHCQRRDQDATDNAAAAAPRSQSHSASATTASASTISPTISGNDNEPSYVDGHDVAEGAHEEEADEQAPTYDRKRQKTKKEDESERFQKRQHMLSGASDVVSCSSPPAVAPAAASQSPPPAVPSSSPSSASASASSASSPFDRLDFTSLQLIFHFLDSRSRILLGRCQQCFLPVLHSAFAWKYARPIRMQLHKLLADESLLPPSRSTLLKRCMIGVEWRWLYPHPSDSSFRTTTARVHAESELLCKRLPVAGPDDRPGLVALKLSNDQHLTDKQWLRVLKSAPFNSLQRLEMGDSWRQSFNVKVVRQIAALPSLRAIQLPDDTLSLDIAAWKSLCSCPTLTALQWTDREDHRSRPSPQLQAMVHAAAAGSLQRLIITRPSFYGPEFRSILNAPACNKLRHLTINSFYASGHRRQLYEPERTLVLDAPDDDILATTFKHLDQLESLHLANVMGVDRILAQLHLSPQLQHLCITFRIASHKEPCASMPSVDAIDRLMQRSPRLCVVVGCHDTMEYSHTNVDFARMEREVMDAAERLRAGLSTALSSAHSSARLTFLADRSSSLPLYCDLDPATLME